MAFINETGTIGVILTKFTTDVTGSLFMTMLVIVILLIALALMFRLPLAYTVPVILPLLIVFMAFTGSFLAIGGVMLIYVAVIFAKMFFIN